MSKKCIYWMFMIFSIVCAHASIPYTYESGVPTGSYPDSTGIELTDGYYPVALEAPSQSWGDAGWVGFQNTDPSIVFDLGVAQSIGSVRLWCFGGTAGINVPAGATISFSDDGTTFSNAVTYGAFAPTSNYTSLTSIPVGGQSARYVKIDLTRNGEWLFLGEAEFFEHTINYTLESGVPHGAYPDSTGIELTDGYYPVALEAPSQSWGDAGWVGFQNTDPNIVFDLGEVQSVDFVRLWCFGGTAGIEVPIGAIVSFSNDGVTFSDAVTYGAFTPTSNYTSLTTIITGPKSARYVKIDLTRNGEWIFLGEVEFIGRSYTYESGTPHGAYPDSTGIELTDGYYPVALEAPSQSWGDAGWVGFQNTDPNIVFDLGVAQSIGSVRLWCFGGTAGINVPAGATISFSNDGVTFSDAVTYGAFAPTSNYTSLTTILADVQSARYVKIDLTRNGEWLFLGEVEFIEKSLITYTYESGTPHGSFADATGVELTDGYFPAALEAPSEPWEDAGWVGFQNTDPSIVFDLGEVQLVDSVDLWCFGGTGGIGVPAGATVSFSNDGVTFADAVTYGAFAPTLNYTSLTTIFTGRKSGRYVKIDLTRNGEWLFLGEVQFQNPPLKASWPDPVDGAEDLPPDITLTWLPIENFKATSGHILYLGNALDDVSETAAPYATLDDSSYSLNDLDLGQTYFWRVDQIDSDDNVYTGDIWQFSVAEYLVVNDLSNPNDWSAAGNGSVALNEIDGNTYIDIDYSNVSSPYFSEATLDSNNMLVGSNWRQLGMEALYIQFRALDPNSAPIYVKVSDGQNTATLWYKDETSQTDPNAASYTSWRIFPISFGEIEAQSVDVTNVASLTVGIGDSAVSGSGGVIQIHSVRLYPPSCSIWGTIPWVVSPLLADITGDCVVDLTDFTELAKAWLSSGYNVTGEGFDATDPNLLVNYTFEDVSGYYVYDSSLNDWTAENYLSEVVYDPIRNSQVLEFADYGWTEILNSNTEAAFNITDALTIAMWIKPGASEDWARPVAKNDAYAFMLRSDGEVLFHCHNSGVGNWGELSGGVVTQDQWHHIAGVFDINSDPARMGLYVDGVMVASAIPSSNINITDDLVTFGQHVAGDDTLQFRGRIDDFVLFKRALSHEEIAGLVVGAGNDLLQPLTESQQTCDIFEDNTINILDLSILCDEWLTKSLWPQI